MIPSVAGLGAIPDKLNLQHVETLMLKATYRVSEYGVSDDGLMPVGPAVIHFVKGNKADPESFRQSGFTTETLLAVCRQYLTENNVGELENEYTAKAIKHINEALFELAERAASRAVRNVQGTYQK